MATIAETRAMGGIGAILVLLTPIPNFGWILGIIGFILILIAIKSISDLLNDRPIFTDMMYSVLCAIIALVIAGAGAIVIVYHLLGLGSFSGSTFIPGSNVQPGDWIAFVIALVPYLLAIWILFIISAIFIRRSLERIKNRLSIGLFGTTGLIYLIGAVTVIIGIGFILILVAEILLAVSFFSINPNSEQLKQPVNAG